MILTEQQKKKVCNECKDYDAHHNYCKSIGIYTPSEGLCDKHLSAQVAQSRLETLREVKNGFLRGHEITEAIINAQARCRELGLEE